VFFCVYLYYFLFRFQIYEFHIVWVLFFFSSSFISSLYIVVIQVFCFPLFLFIGWFFGYKFFSCFSEFFLYFLFESFFSFQHLGFSCFRVLWDVNVVISKSYISIFWFSSARFFGIILILFVLFFLRNKYVHDYGWCIVLSALMSLFVYCV